MISLIEAEEDTPGNLSQVKKDLGDAISESALNVAPTNDANATPKKTRVIEVNDEELPENLRGKDVKDLVSMIKESQSTIGRMANDLGQQRALTDRLLDLKRQSDLRVPDVDEKPIKVNVDEMLDNPTDAIERVVAARLAKQEKAMQEQMRQLEGQLVAEKFLTKHPDYQEIAADQDFASWVRQTPYRARLADQAASGDWGVADELLSEYKDRKQLKSVTKNKEEKDPDLEAARGASLERSGGNGRDAASGRTGKIYKRADLLRLQLEDPETYYDEAFQAEIMRAYNEKRVK